MESTEQRGNMNEIWIEKYRLRKLTDFVGQEGNVEKLSAFVKQKDIPHLIFSGPAGTGKTSAAISVAIELFGEDWKENFLELNASSNRGIDIMRGHEDRSGSSSSVSVKDYARIKPSNPLGFKIVFLDEADQLTSEAQAALRRTMEIYSSTTRFILSCNYSSQIIPPIQSRCVVLKFRPISPEDIKKRIREIADYEKFEIDEDCMNAIAELSEGDMRRVINVLQTLHSSGEMTEKKVYEIFGYSAPGEFKAIVSTALEHGLFDEARNKLDELLIDQGISGIDIIKGIHSAVRKHPMTPRRKMDLILALAEAEFRIVEGGSDNIQLDALLAKIVKIGIEGD